MRVAQQSDTSWPHARAGSPPVGVGTRASRGGLLVAALAILTVLLTPWRAAGCSKVAPPFQVAIGPAGEIAFVVRNQAKPPHAIFYDQAGAEIGRVDLQAAENLEGLWLLEMEDDRSLWLQHRCGPVGTRQPCSRFVLFDREGMPVDEILAGGDLRLVDGVVAGASRKASSVVFFRADPETGDPKPWFSVAEFFLPDKRPGYARWTWTPDARGGVVATMREGNGDDFFLRRYDARGLLSWEQRFDAVSHTPSLSILEDESPKLGAVRGIHVGADGILLRQYGFGPDCRDYQSPSVAIFTGDGALVAVVDLDSPAKAARFVDGEILLVTERGDVIRTDRHGNELSRWSFDWRRHSGLGSEDPQVRLAAVIENGAGADAAEVAWALGNSGRHHQEVLALALARGPELYPHLSDHQWQQLAASFCAEHGAVAPEEAWRRFRTAPRASKPSWLACLGACLEVGPPEAIELAVELVIADPDAVQRWEHVRSARQALLRWGFPPEVLEELWRRAARVPPPRGLRPGETLLLAFEQTAPTFDGFLRRAAGTELETARRMLFEAAIAWGPEAEWRPREVLAVRPAIAAQAAIWAMADDATVAATGRLLGLAFGSGDDRALLGALRADVERDPSLLVWIGGVLAARSRTASIAGGLTGAAAFQELLELGLESGDGSLHGVHLHDASLVSPWSELAGSFPQRGWSLLRRRAGATEATDEDREKVFQAAWRKAPELGFDRLRPLLEEPWIATDSASAYRAWNLMELLWQLEPQAERRAWLEDRFRQLLPALVAEAPGARAWMAPSPSQPVLPSTVPPELLAALVAANAEAVRANAFWIQQIGPWPEVVPLLEADLEVAQHRLPAAMVLAHVRHPDALPVLLAELPGHVTGVDEALTLYGDEVRPFVEQLLFDDDPIVRGRARHVLRSIGPRPADVDRLAKEFESKLEGPQLPHPQLVLLLEDAGRDTAERYLRVVHASGGDGRLIPSDGPLPNLDLLVQLGEIAMASADEAVRSGAARLFSDLGLRQPLAEAWRARLDSVAVRRGAGSVEVSEQPAEGGRR